MALPSLLLAVTTPRSGPLRARILVNPAAKAGAELVLSQGIRGIVKMGKSLQGGFRDGNLFSFFLNLKPKIAFIWE
jgi:hypothetical protein